MTTQPPVRSMQEMIAIAQATMMRGRMESPTPIITITHPYYATIAHIEQELAVIKTKQGSTKGTEIHITRLAYDSLVNTTLLGLHATPAATPTRGRFIMGMPVRIIRAPRPLRVLRLLHPSQAVPHTVERQLQAEPHYEIQATALCRDLLCARAGVPHTNEFMGTPITLINPPSRREE